MSVQPSFIFGGDTGISSPEELARLRAISMALSQPSAPKNAGEGLSALGQALGYRMMQGKVNKMQAEGNASATNAIANALGASSVGPFPAAPGAPPPSDGGGGAAGGPQSYRDAIAGIESAGSGDYNAVGPTSPTLGRALGKYQVMEANVGPWSKEALGREVSPEEFLANPKIQDAVFDHKFGSYVQKYGNPQDAASAWFTGGPLSSGAHKKDVLGTTGAAYVDKFSRGLGGGGAAAALPNPPQAQQVASLDPAVGMPAAPSPVAAALQLPAQGPIPQARPDVAAALNGAPQMPNPGVGDPAATTPAGQRVLGQMMSPLPMGGQSTQMQPPAGAPMPAPAAPQGAGQLPPLPSREIGPDPMGAAPQGGPIPPQAIPNAPPAQPNLDQIPVEAGGNAGAIQPGGHAPTMQQLMALAGNPWAMQKYGPVIQSLLAQQMKLSDPAYAIDLADKKVQLQLHQQQIGGNFRGDSMDAQAWNILQTADPGSKQYATAYAIVSQPKNQLVQTPQGQQLIAIPPALPPWLKAPGGADAGQPAGVGPAAQSAPGSGAAAAGGVIPGTKPAPTEMQARNGAIGKILLNEVPTLGKTFGALADPKGQFLNAIPGGIGNAWQSEEYQRAASAVKTSVANVLYSLSGASSNPGEVLKQIEVLTPAFGDKPGTIADKLNRFKTYVRSVSSEANDPELTKSVEDALKQMEAPADAPQKDIKDMSDDELKAIINGN